MRTPVNLIARAFKSNFARCYNKDGPLAIDPKRDCSVPSGRTEPAMRMHILGCGDAFGSGGRNQSGYLVEANDRLFLLDCGPTTLLAMKRAGIDPGRLDAILVSHLHGDHFGGIPFFFIEYL